MNNMRILEVVKGKDAGTFLLQVLNEKSCWKTIGLFKSRTAAEKKYIELSCPFKDNKRIVNDITFAVRFKRFLENIQPCDACTEHELEYLRYVVENLLKYQVYTVQPDSDEERYLHNCGVL